MPDPITAEDVLPLVANLTPQERIRLIKLIAVYPDVDAATLYDALPPGPDEFSTDEDPLAWDAEGWEKFD